MLASRTSGKEAEPTPGGRPAEMLAQLCPPFVDLLTSGCSCVPDNSVLRFKSLKSMLTWSECWTSRPLKVVPPSLVSNAPRPS